MIECGPNIERAELVEICEKIVAQGLNELSEQDLDGERILETWKGFMSSKHSRVNIIELLLQPIVRDIHMLGVDNACEFVALTRHLSDEAACLTNASS